MIAHKGQWRVSVCCGTSRTAGSVLWGRRTEAEARRNRRGRIDRFLSCFFFFFLTSLPHVDYIVLSLFLFPLPGSREWVSNTYYLCWVLPDKQIFIYNSSSCVLSSLIPVLIPAVHLSHIYIRLFFPYPRHETVRKGAMADNNELPVNGNVERSALSSDFTIKAGLARMLKGGVIMDVVNAEQVCSPFMTSSLFFSYVRYG